MIIRRLYKAVDRLSPRKFSTALYLNTIQKYAMLTTPKVPMEREKFIQVFRDWLKKKHHDGVFYKNEHGWFIMNGCKKVCMPEMFQNFQELLGVKEKPDERSS